jgi:hypothetical protein
MALLIVTTNRTETARARLGQQPRFLKDRHEPRLGTAPDCLRNIGDAFGHLGMLDIGHLYRSLGVAIPKREMTSIVLATVRMLPVSRWPTAPATSVSCSAPLEERNVCRSS